MPGGGSPPGQPPGTADGGGGQPPAPSPARRRSLYHITEEVRRALDDLEDMLEEGHIDDETFRDTVEGVEGLFDDKALAVAAFCRELEAHAKAIKEAKTSMEKRQKSAENKVKRLKAYLLDSMVAVGKTKVESPELSVSIRNNRASVWIDGDPTIIPDEYRSEETTIKIDKAALYRALKGGAEIDGARLVPSQSVVIR